MPDFTPQPSGRYTPPSQNAAAAEFQRLMESVARPDADELVAQCSFVLESVLGHPVTFDEARAFMAGCSYVGQAARLAKLTDKGVMIVDAAVEAALSIAVGVVEPLAPHRQEDPDVSA